MRNKMHRQAAESEWNVGLPPQDGPEDSGRISGLVEAIWRGWLGDLGEVSLKTLIARSLRRLQALRLGPDLPALLRLPIYQTHLRALGVTDPLFFLAQRHYLARGMGLADRARAASAHYLAEGRHQPQSYLSAVYHGEGLALWTADVDGHHYEIRLTRALDVANEGALSVSLLADGLRAGIMSFSHFPAQLLGVDTDLADLTVFVVRKQLTREQSYQKTFFRAFDRCTPAHLLLAAVEGLVQARGGNHIHGVRATCHPAITAENAQAMTAAYDDFWVSVGGKAVSGCVYRIPVPMHLSDVEDMKPDRRARALARRGHVAAVRQATRAVMQRQV